MTGRQLYYQANSTDSDRLDKVQLLGFSPTAVAGVVHLSKLRSLEELIDEISKPIPVILSQWLQGIFDGVWQPKPNFQVHNYQPARVQDSTKLNVPGVKLIDIGKNQVELLITLIRDTEQKVDIIVQIKPTNKQPHLPANLTLALLSDTGQTIDKVKSSGSSMSLEIPRFTANIDNNFSIQISCDNLIFQEDFVI
ncbi:DUF1822 family protein [Desmonostoc muscorum CCALA 125]|nr:DUF1822 family protein [Desmonostoc muscorum CCALA 125]